VLLQRIESRTTNDYGKRRDERELTLKHVAEVEHPDFRSESR
jgi:hypothetical protein